MNLYTSVETNDVGQKYDKSTTGRGETVGAPEHDSYPRRVSYEKEGTFLGNMTETPTAYTTIRTVPHMLPQTARRKK